MAKFRIVHERDRCIGCGACASACPDNWKMEDDGKSSPKKQSWMISDAAKLLLANVLSSASG